MFFIFIYLLTTVSSMVYQRSFDVWRDGNYTFTWQINTNTQMITFDLRARTTGWVGFGLGKNPNYQPTNLFAGWIDAEGKPQVYEYYSLNGTATPVRLIDIGIANGLENISGNSANGWTRLRFSRKLIPADTVYSVAVTQGQQMPMLFALRDTDNPSTTYNQILPETRRQNARVVLYPTSIPLQRPVMRRSVRHPVSGPVRHGPIRHGPTGPIRHGPPGPIRHGPPAPIRHGPGPIRHGPPRRPAEIHRD
jgi:hypothetical protein